MSKFIELHRKGKPHLLNIDRIFEICKYEDFDFGTIVYQDDKNEILVDEDYETVKSLIAGEQKTQKVTEAENDTQK